MHLTTRIGATLLTLVLLAATGAPGAAGQGHGLDQATPAASPVAGASWTVTDVRPVDVDGIPVTLSPDGRRLAGINHEDQLCIWSADTFEVDACDETPLPIYTDSIAWAPDSSAVAFSLDAFRLAEESDIYVFERDAGASVNLTPDDIDGSWFGVEGEPVPIDAMPTWAPDGQSLTFARTTANEEPDSTELLTIDRAGGEPEPLHTASADLRFTIYTPMFSLADGSLLYANLPPTPDGPDAGIWRLDANGEAALLLPGTATDEYPMPAISDVVERDGTFLVAGYSIANMSQFAIDQPVAFTLDLSTGTLTPLDGPDDDPGAVPGPVGFSPDGATTLSVLLGGPDDFIIAGPAGNELVPLEPSNPSRNEVYFRGPDWVEGGIAFVPGGLAPGPYLLTVTPAGATPAG